MVNCLLNILLFEVDVTCPPLQTGALVCGVRESQWYRDLVVADLVVDALEGMKLKVPAGPEGVDYSKLKIV